MQNQKQPICHWSVTVDAFVDVVSYVDESSLSSGLDIFTDAASDFKLMSCIAIDLDNTNDNMDVAHLLTCQKRPGFPRHCVSRLRRPQERHCRSGKNSMKKNGSCCCFKVSCRQKRSRHFPLQQPRISRRVRQRLQREYQ